MHFLPFMTHPKLTFYTSDTLWRICHSL